MANAGEIKIDTFTIGGLDLTDASKAKHMGINIYESILSPITKAEVRVMDDTDALGKNKINGKEDVTLSFSSDTFSDSPSFKFKLLQNNNLDDMSQEQRGSLSAKFYDLKMVSPEHLNAQANHVQKSYKDTTANIVKDIATNYMKSEKEVKILENTKGQQRMILHHSPYDALDILHRRHVSENNDSSHLFLFYPSRDGGKETLEFASFDHLMKQESSLGYTLTQDNTIASGPPELNKQMANMLWVNVPNSFDTMSRWGSSSNRITYNRADGKLQNKQYDSSQYKPSGVAESPVYTSGNWDQVKLQQRPRTPTNISPSEDKDKTFISDARTRQKAALAHMAQNYIEFEIPGNPSIKLGSVIPLKIPKKSGTDKESGETQMNNKVLVVGIRHIIRSAVESPCYTMIIRGIKAGFAEGGGGNG